MPAATSDEIVRLVRVSRRFPPDIVALDDVDLDIHLGDFVAITGASGSGKSTLLNVIGLLDAPTSGEYWLGGRQVSGLANTDVTRLRAKTIGFVFQAFHLVPHLTVAENVELSLAYAGVDRKLRSAEALEALDQMALGPRAQALPTTLSGGERQRVAIARALVRRPLLMLCDEPTGNLDSKNTRLLLNLLEASHSPDRALVIVTHESEVAARANRVLKMKDGTLVDRTLA